MMHIREHLDIPLTEIVSITLKFWLKVMGNDVINDEEKEVSIPGKSTPDGMKPLVNILFLIFSSFF